MASSSHVRKRLEKNAHMLGVPSSSRKVALHYPPILVLITFRAVRSVSGGSLTALPVRPAGRPAARAGRRRRPGRRRSRPGSRWSPPGPCVNLPGASPCLDG
jgi:hypothetical protein